MYDMVWRTVDMIYVWWTKTCKKRHYGPLKNRWSNTKETEHACIDTKKQMDGRRTTFDTTPMASHTVTLLSCEACINEEGEETEGGGRGGLQGVKVRRGGGGRSVWLVNQLQEVAEEEEEEEEELTSRRQAELESPRSC